MEIGIINHFSAEQTSEILKNFKADVLANLYNQYGKSFVESYRVNHKAPRIKINKTNHLAILSNVMTFEELKNHIKDPVIERITEPVKKL
jgi:hypothetical protein